MLFRYFFTSLALVGTILPLSAFAQSGGMKGREAEMPPAAQALTTNQKSFTIPVSVDRSQPGHTPVEVQLLVTADQGKTWSTYARQGIEAKGFPFQTRDDGEYWFASRTVDKLGNTKPAGVVVPELKLMLDATPPRIELDAAAGGTGDVKAAWRVTDATIDANSIQLEYQASEVQQLNWQKINLTSDQLKITGNLVTGELTFTPNANGRTVDVRLIAHDHAGNAHSEVRRVMLPRVAKANPQIPSWPPRFASTPPATTKDSRPNYANDPFTSRMPTGPATNPAPVAATVKPSESKVVPPKTAEPWPTDNVIATQKPAVDPFAKTAERSVVDVAPQVRDGVLAQPSTGPETPLIWPSDAANARTATPEEVKPSQETLPKDAPVETRLPREPSSPDLGTINHGKLPDDAKPLLSPSKSFSLDYDLDSVGPAGVKAVELWVTTDGANSWRKWGEDSDKKSPFEIQVESERTFGFRMVIVSNNGLATRPPEPGDTADVWVKIDTTKPTVRITQAGYGQGEHAGQLDIRWQVDDEHLNSRPVTIVFSESPEGPFTTLAAGLPNTGQYFWTIDPRTPRQLYLRLEVRDEAGNLGIDQTTEPVSLEGLAPRGRIRSIAPSAPGDIRGAFKTPLFR